MRNPYRLSHVFASKASRIGKDFKGAVAMEDLAYMFGLAKEDHRKMVASSMIHLHRILTICSMMVAGIWTFLTIQELWRRGISLEAR